MENISNNLKWELKERKQKIDGYRSEIQHLEQKLTSDEHCMKHNKFWINLVKRPANLVDSGLYMLLLPLIFIGASLPIAAFAPEYLLPIFYSVICPILVYPLLVYPFYVAKEESIQKCEKRLRKAKEELRSVECITSGFGYNIDLISYKDLEIKEEVVQADLCVKQSVFTKLLNKLKKKSTTQKTDNKYEPDNANDTISL